MWGIFCAFLLLFGGIDPDPSSPSCNCKVWLETVNVLLCCQMTNSSLEIWQELETTNGHADVNPNMAAHFTWHTWARREESEDGHVTQGERGLSPRVQRSALCWRGNVRLRMEKIRCWCCGQTWIMKLSHFEWWRMNLRWKKEKVGHCGVTQHPDELKLVSVQVLLTGEAQQVWITAGRNTWTAVYLSI